MAECALGVGNLEKHYPGFLLDHVSFQVPRGTIVGLVGENGAGKSTTLSAILGLIRADAGEISILGKSGAEIDRAVRAQTGVVFDGGNFPEQLSPKKLEALLKSICPAFDSAVYTTLLEKLGLPAGRKIKRLSKGMKMKLSIAAALANRPRLLLLDVNCSTMLRCVQRVSCKENLQRRTAYTKA